MGKILKVGVVGVGYLGRHHARIYSGMKGANLIGVFDIDGKRAVEVARELGAKAFKSYGDLLREVDALSIVVPTVAHYEISVEALRCGVNVMLEKPIADRLEYADEIVEVAEKKGLVLQVGHIERFNRALKAIEGKEIDPKFIEAHRLALFTPRGTDTAVILDLMIHDIDIALALVRGEPEEIQAAGVAVVSDTVDIANARISFEGGCVANLTASRISNRKMRRMRIFQKDAYFALDFLKGEAEIYRVGGSGGVEAPLGDIGLGVKRVHIAYEKIVPPPGDHLELELKSFLNSVAKGTPPTVSGRDGRKALEIALKVSDEVKETLSRMDGKPLG